MNGCLSTFAIFQVSFEQLLHLGQKACTCNQIKHGSPTANAVPHQCIPFYKLV